MDYAPPYGGGSYPRNRLFYTSRDPAGSFNATANTLDEMAVPLLKSSRELDEPMLGDEVIGHPTDSPDIEICLLKSSSFRESILERRFTSSRIVDCRC